MNQRFLSASGDDIETVRRWCAASDGFEFRDAGSRVIHVTTTRSNAEKYTYIPETGSLSDEIFRLETRNGEIQITYSGERGLWYGLNALESMIRSNAADASGKLADCVIEDYPLFPVRGIIEGFYGRPWSQSERLDMVRYISKHNMNAYFYAPKDDLFHRKRWRDLYDESAYEKLREHYESAKAHCLAFYYCIAPGLSMKYASKEDFNDLIEKIRQIHQLGVKRFGLLLDDIPDQLQHSEDKEAFEDLVTAHIDLIRRFHATLVEMVPEARLVVCPTQYCGKGNEYYISKLGRSIHPSIDLFWTGRNICSQEIDLMEASVFTRSTYHMPLYWDNYPVNDVEMVDEMHIGPFLGRDPHLYRFSRGLVANGMEYAESSKIAFATIAAYLWNPHRYEPERTWRNAIREMAGERDYEHLLQFADNVRFSCLYPTDSPQLSAALSDLEFGYLYGNREEAIANFSRLVADMSASAAALHGEVANTKLQQELGRWIRKYEQACGLLAECVAYLQSPHAKQLEQIASKYDTYKSDPTYIFADVLTGFIDKIVQDEFQIITGG